MPEGPEVRIFARFLKKHMNLIKSINIIGGRYKKMKIEGYNKLENNYPLIVSEIGVKGKFTYIKFQNDIIMTVQLGLSGGWCLKENDRIIEPILGKYVMKYNEKYADIEFQLDDNKKIIYYDKLHNGIIKFINNNELIEKLNEIGPDIMHKNMTFAIYNILLKKYDTKRIGEFMLDQKIISGIGNYLRAEILYKTCINPFRLINSLSDVEIYNLYNTSKKYMETSYMNPLMEYEIYNNTHDKNMYLVQKDKLGGSNKSPRYIHWIPQIQK